MLLSQYSTAKKMEKNSTTLSSDHLKSACYVVSDPLSDFFTSVPKHGYICLQHYVTAR